MTRYNGNLTNILLQTSCPAAGIVVNFLGDVLPKLPDDRQEGVQRAVVLQPEPQPAQAAQPDNRLPFRPVPRHSSVPRRAPGRDRAGGGGGAAAARRCRDIVMSGRDTGRENLQATAKTRNWRQGGEVS